SWLAPQKGIAVTRAGGYTSPSHQAMLKLRSGTDLDAIPDHTIDDGSLLAHRDATEHASPRLALMRGAARQEPSLGIKGSRVLWKRPFPREYSKCGAQKIARLTEIGKRSSMQHVANFFAALKHRLPDMPDEGCLPLGKIHEKRW